MRISKDECDKEFAERRLIPTKEKCEECEFYLFLCPFIAEIYREGIREVTSE